MVGTFGSAGVRLGVLTASATSLPSLDMRQRGGDPDAGEVDPPGHHFVERFRPAAERHVDALEAGADAQPLGRPMGGAPDAGGRVGELARLCLDHELLQRLDALLGRDDGDVRHLPNGMTAEKSLAGS